MIRGFSLFKRGFGPDGPSDFYVLASWHHPASITWRWALYWHPPRRSTRFARMWVRHNCGGHATLTMPLIGSLAVSWQDAMWRKEHGE